MDTCLMIRTTDHRQFFILEKHQELIAEFVKVFNAEVSLVYVAGAEILDITPLATALCNALYVPAVSPKYEVIKVIREKVKRKLRKHEA